MADIGHAVEIEGTNEESLDEASDLSIVMNVVSLSEGCDECSSERSLEHLLKVKIIIIYIYLI